MKQIKVFKAEIKSVNEEDYTVTALISTGQIDRDMEVIKPEAFKKRLKLYKEHPVVLSSHAYFDLRKQIGDAKKGVRITDEGVEAKIQYYVGEGNPEADWAFNLAKKGIASYSIGFMAFGWDDGVWDAEKQEYKNGIRRVYTDIEMFEFSQVLVPSNRGALQTSLQSEDAVEKELAEVALKSFEFTENGEAKEAKEAQEKSLALKAQKEKEQKDEALKREKEFNAGIEKYLDTDAGKEKISGIILDNMTKGGILLSSIKKLIPAKDHYTKALFGEPEAKTSQATPKAEAISGAVEEAFKTIKI